jgi:hypothetical protein
VTIYVIYSNLILGIIDKIIKLKNVNLIMFIYIIAHANKSSEHNFNFKHSFLSEFNSASEQAGKLELGKNKTVICFYTNNQVCI